MSAGDLPGYCAPAAEYGERLVGLAETHSVLEVFRDLGLRVVRHFDGPEVHCTVQLAQDENYPSAVDARGRASDVISNLHNGSFTGRLFAVRPEATAIGPLVMLGLGGTATELLADHAAGLAPLTDRDVHDLLTAPRCSPLLFG
ncbi:acetate--CoA ligase family protein [Streptomyces achromogenes]|uniref:acetate--CoA ligase family protein n=1 Tax=Streptomyces achromogenes TaxID=67255 RepID=UPI0036942C4F